jgi:hypothetical protein
MKIILSVRSPGKMRVEDFGLLNQAIVNGRQNSSLRNTVRTVPKIVFFGLIFRRSDLDLVKIN